MHAVYSASGAAAAGSASRAGSSSYGPKFKTIDYFVTKHLVGSASRSCDAWHDDAGMANHHSAISLEFEQALQVHFLVFPMCSLRTTS